MLEGSMSLWLSHPKTSRSARLSVSSAQANSFAPTAPIGGAPSASEGSVGVGLLDASGAPFERIELEAENEQFIDPSQGSVGREGAARSTYVDRLRGEWTLRLSVFENHMHITEGAPSFESELWLEQDRFVVR